MFRSGTVKVADVDGYYDSVLETFGEIGITLDNGTTSRECTKWVNEQTRERGKIECPLPCPPTYELLKDASRGYWKYRYKRVKSGSNCVFSSEWSSRYSPFECCYKEDSGILVDTPGPGAGRTHLYHPVLFMAAYQAEEDVYRDCCSGQNNESCGLFYSLRPTCNSSNWQLYRSKLGMLKALFTTIVLIGACDFYLHPVCRI